MINLSNIDEKEIHLRKERERDNFFQCWNDYICCSFFFINLDRFFLTQGVGVDSGDEEELVFVLCFINSRWFHDVFVFQPDKTHLSNQIQSLKFFWKVFIFVFFFYFVPAICMCACIFIHQWYRFNSTFLCWLGEGGGVS